MSSDNFNQIEVGHTALVGVLIIPSAILWTCSLCLVRRKADPARRFTTFFKIAFALWNVFLILDTVAYICYLMNMYVYTYYDLANYPKVAQAGDRTFYVGRIFECFGQLGLFLTLLELGFDIIFAYDGRRSAWHSICRFAGLGAVLVLGAIELAHFSLAQVFYSDLYGSTGLAFYEGTTDAAKSTVVQARRVFISFVTLLFVLSVCVSAFAILVRMRVGQSSRVNKPMMLFMVAAFLWLLRNTWMIGQYGSWAGLACYACSTFPDWSEIVDPILNVWVTFVVFVLVYVLAARRAPVGLWTVADASGPTNDMEQIHDASSGFERPGSGPREDASHEERLPRYREPAVPLQDVNGMRDVKHPL